MERMLPATCRLRLYQPRDLLILSVVLMLPLTGATYPLTACPASPPQVLGSGAWSWWSEPVAQVIDGALYRTTISSDGDQMLWSGSGSTVVGAGLADDHAAPIALFHTGRQPLVIRAEHDTASWIMVNQRRLDFPGVVSYIEAFTPAADRVVILTRVARCRWYAVASDNWGVSWSTPQLVLDDCAEGQNYLLVTPDGDAAAYVHPNVATHGRIEVGRFNFASLSLSGMETFYDTPDHVRLLDLGRDAGKPMLLLAAWGNTGDPDYRLARAHSVVPLIGAGKPFWAPSTYVGGAVFSGDTVVLSREQAGTWWVERYDLTGHRLDVLACDDEPLVRPYAVRGSDDILLQRLDRYDDFRNFKITTLLTTGS